MPADHDITMFSSDCEGSSEMKREHLHVSNLLSRLRLSAFSARERALSRKRPPLLLIGLILILLTGCGQPTGPVFSPLDNPIYWPAPPQQPRIEYVGKLQTDRDLNAGRTIAQSIGRFLFGEKSASAMTSPYSIATDGNDRVFVCDSGSRIVHVFNLESRRYEQWSPSGKDRDGFAQPIGIAWQSSPHERLYVADAARGVIFVFDALGNLLSEIGAEYVMRPCGLALDEQRGRLYVADPAMHQVIVLNERGDLLHRLGTRGTSAGEFNFPTDVAVDSKGRLYVSDSLNFRVQQFDADLNFIRQIGQRGNTPGHFSQPKGLALDSEDHLYVVDAHFETVQIFDSLGRLLLYFGSEGHGPGEFWIPAGLHIDHQNRIWIADTYNRRAQVFQYLPDTRSIAEAQQ
jgi:DNA-binding beta-propeller fold protein YncE